VTYDDATTGNLSPPRERGSTRLGHIPQRLDTVSLG